MARAAVRIFLDSNVILSGLLSDRGAPRIILDLLCLKLPFVVGLTGQYNLIEIERNISKKIPEVLPVYKAYLPKLNLEIIPLPLQNEVKRFSGHVSDKDVPVLVSAVNGKADFLVTGDKKDFDKLKLKNDYTFKILNPSEFIDLILPEILKDLR
jgi:predicted nucleic acid-binding protein